MNVSRAFPGFWNLLGFFVASPPHILFVFPDSFFTSSCFLAQMSDLHGIASMDFLVFWLLVGFVYWEATAREWKRGEQRYSVYLITPLGL